MELADFMAYSGVSNDWSPVKFDLNQPIGRMFYLKTLHSGDFTVR